MKGKDCRGHFSVTMHNQDKIMRVIMALVFSAALGYCGLVGPRSLSDLEQSADLIVVGSASADIQVGAPLVNFDLKVNRVVKGDPTVAGQAIAVSWASPGGFLTGMIDPAGSHVVENGTGLWFLQRSATGWALLSVLTGSSVSLKDAFFPAPAGPIPSPYAYSTTASLSDKVAAELAAAIEANNTFSIQMSGLSYLLDELKSPVVQVLYQRMSTSASPEHRILGLSGLIQNGDAAALSAAAQVVPDSKGTVEHGTLLNGVRDGFRTTDAGSISVLGRIALDSNNPSRDFREAAAHALASIHNRAALPYLATLLDDPDEKLRIEGIGGLGCFANGTHMQTTANTPSLASLQLTGDGTYRTAETIANFAQGEQAIERNEAGYLAFWKGWWSSNRASLGY
jgi:hypothetical protein